MTRVLLGYVLIALIGSTALSLVIFGERIREPLEILEIVVPDRVFGREIGTTDQFSFAFLARRNIANVEVRFGVLREVQLGEELPSGPLLQKLSAITQVQRVRELLSDANATPDEIETTVIFEGARCDMVAIDFTPIYGRIASETDLRHTPTMFAAVFWPNGTLAGYFRGYGTCFPAMEESLYDMRIVVGGQTLFFSSMESARPGENVRPLSEAPGLGLMHWSHLRRDEKVVVQYRVHGSAFKFLETARTYFSRRNILLVQVWVDGRPWRTIARELLSAVGA